MRRIACAGLLATGLVATAPAVASAALPTIELRLTPPVVRPDGLPSICPLLAFPLTEHFWIGGGYEAIQDYDAILWTSDLQGYKPIVMQGLRAGAWYRGGAARHGMSWAAGGLFTLATPAVSLASSPSGIDNHTAIIDFGGDFSIGYVWQGFRLEAFATPAWSFGQVASPAIHEDARYSALTYRFGVALAVLVGS